MTNSNEDTKNTENTDAKRRAETEHQHDHDHDHGHDHDHDQGQGHSHGGRSFGRRHCWKFPFVVAAIVLIKSAVVFFLWNDLIPDLFHGPTITYLQAIGLVILAKVLVGFGGPGRHFGGRFGGPPPWVRAKWAALTPEEREKLREELRHRWHHHGH